MVLVKQALLTLLSKNNQGSILLNGVMRKQADAHLNLSDYLIIYLYLWEITLPHYRQRQIQICSLGQSQLFSFFPEED